jgi:membrane-bound metal-dependent hydrolase YbcI (DUF457 family)
MPSPLGHSLAGLAIGFAAEPAPVAQTSSKRLSSFAIVGALIAAAPDLDLLYPGFHRSITHSVGATAIVMIITAAVTGWVTGHVRWRWVWLVGAAHASHILMDWMGTDHFAPAGLEALWPFSRAFYISGWDIFPATERRLYLPDAWMINLRAFVVEVGLMVPIAAFAFAAKRTRRSRGRTSVPDTRLRPSASAAGTADISDHRAPRAGH